MPNKKLVIVEDEPDILEVLIYNFDREGFEVTGSLEGDKGLKLIQQQMPDLVLLDLMLPGMDGLEICRQLKDSDLTQNIPIIMVTAKGEESDVVLGLGIGADDYISKPFSPKELIARVKAVLRRYDNKSSSTHKSRITMGDLIIDIDKHKVSLEGIEINLTATEFRLLHSMASHPGKVFTREQLLNHGFGVDAVVVDRNIDVHIRSIRKKIGGKKQFIETIRGVGYRFRELK